MRKIDVVQLFLHLFLQLFLHLFLQLFLQLFLDRCHAVIFHLFLTEPKWQVTIAGPKVGPKKSLSP